MPDTESQPGIFEALILVLESGISIEIQNKMTPMALRTTILLMIILLSAAGLQAQEEEPVLFTVAGEPVPVSEFKYIYEKTNGKEADYSRKSLKEYLDLYVRFKLKVKRAEEMRLDTIPSLQRELAGYRRQLADSYLIDREVTDKLVREAYERTKQDVDISQILLALPPTALPEDTARTYRKAMGIIERLESGENFEAVAREVSDDKTVDRNGGHIGYVTALFPDGYYALENAVYSLPEGTISDPIRTNTGYHIIRVNDRRPARGEIEAAHLMLRLKDQNSDVLKARIDSIYQALQAGADFEELARTFSEDSYTAEKGGYIGFFGINRYEDVFEDAAFSIKEDGAFSQPFQSSIGWHIIKRISKRDIQPFDIARRRLETQIKKNSRHEAARKSLIEKVKEEAGFTEYPETLEAFAASLTDDFFSFRWKAPEDNQEAMLFTLKPDFEVSLGDFTEYLTRNMRQRSSMSRGANLEYAVGKLYGEFVDDKIMEYEESKLEKKYPEFKYLMNEYEEGILLFEATQREVWNKASQDSAGLARFYDRIRGKYRWEERARVSVFYLNADSKDIIGEVRTYAAAHPAEEVLGHFNAEDKIIVSMEEKLLEKTKNDLLVGTPWREGALSTTKENSRNQSLSFVKIEEILPAADKTLDEARGYIIADYQDYLESQWVEELKDRYEVDINEKAFEELVKE
jgi:peptidyl-prolyl cis-trans isomerase SurA